MNEIKSLREKMGGLKKQCEDIVKQALTEKRAMTAEEEGKYNPLFDEMMALEKTINKIERSNEIKYEQSKPANGKDGITVEERAALESKAFRKSMISGPESLTAEERAVYNPFEKRATTDPQSVTTTAGGYLVPTILEDTLIKALKAYGGVRDVAAQFQTEGGYPLDMATIDDTSNKGILLDINTQSVANHLVFGKKTFYAYKFSSQMVLLPTELLQDEKVDINAYLTDLFMERVGRIESDYFTTGTGSGQPEGCQYAATASGVRPAAAAITKANLIDLMYSVDPLYRRSPKAAFMFNDATAKVLFKLSLGTTLDVPVFSSALGLATNADRMADKMFGFPYVINQSMPDIGAGNKSVIFGDFSRFKIRDVAGFRMLRLTERYADYDQIAVILLHRADSRMLTSGAIKYMIHANT